MHFSLDDYWYIVTVFLPANRTMWLNHCTVSHDRRLIIITEGWDAKVYKRQFCKRTDQDYILDSSEYSPHLDTYLQVKGRKCVKGPEAWKRLKEKTLRNSGKQSGHKDCRMSLSVRAKLWSSLQIKHNKNFSIQIWGKYFMITADWDH